MQKNTECIQCSAFISIKTFEENLGKTFVDAFLKSEFEIAKRFDESNKALVAEQIKKLKKAEDIEVEIAEVSIKIKLNEVKILQLSVDKIRASSFSTTGMQTEALADIIKFKKDVYRDRNSLNDRIAELKIMRDNLLLHPEVSPMDISPFETQAETYVYSDRYTSIFNIAVRELAVLCIRENADREYSLMKFISGKISEKQYDSKLKKLVVSELANVKYKKILERLRDSISPVLQNTEDAIELYKKLHRSIVEFDKAVKLCTVEDDGCTDRDSFLKSHREIFRLSLMKRVYK